MRSNLLERAISFAADKHKNQFRKEGGLLYISHLFSVALILKKYKYEDDVIAAGLLHDTLEDTGVTREEIKNEFGENILNIIISVTDDLALSWKDKKLKYIKAVSESSEHAVAVALADKIHNMQCTIFNLENMEKEIFWSKFSASREDKLWFEEECLFMFKKVKKTPPEMIDEYESMIIELKQKYI
jgi:(p)ppGpp synthase/HD superfamily hydrolase